MEDILKYIKKLENKDFEGWSMEKRAGYIGALNQVKFFIESGKNENLINPYEDNK